MKNKREFPVNVEKLLFKYRNDEYKFKIQYINKSSYDPKFDYFETVELANEYWDEKDNLIKNLLRKEKLKNILDNEY